MTELDGVRDQDGFGFIVNYFETVVVIEGKNNVVTIVSAVVRLLGLVWMMTQQTMGPRGMAE